MVKGGVGGLKSAQRGGGNSAGTMLRYVLCLIKGNLRTLYDGISLGYMEGIHE